VFVAGVLSGGYAILAQGDGIGSRAMDFGMRLTAAARPPVVESLEPAAYFPSESQMREIERPRPSKQAAVSSEKADRIAKR
jgi:hypothetical protein